MKAYERRATGQETYYKLATWDERNACWKAGRIQYESEAAARGDARARGRYRISKIDRDGKTELEPFMVG